MARCPKCSAHSFNPFLEHGTGKVQCSQCRGSGVIKTTRGEKKDCPKCYGTGKMDCPRCGGSGRL